MDEATLWRLADVGVAALPPHQLRSAVRWCWDRCETAGDARFCAIARALEPIAAEFDEHDEAGGVAFDFSDIDRELRLRLPAVLEEPDIEAAALLARAMREEIWRLFVSGR